MNTHPAAQQGTDSTQAAVLDLNERNWLPRHCRGDEQAFEELLLAYRGLVYTFLYRYGIETDNRDDLFQDIFLKILRSASSYQASEPLRPWVVSIVLNTVRNFRRDRGRKQHFTNRLMIHLEAVSANPETGSPVGQPYEGGPEQQAEQQSTLQWLERRITTLPDRQREVLVLSTVKGLRMKDISVVMALPENTVKTLLRRARLALAESLARREDPEKYSPVSPSVGTREEDNEQL